MFKIEKNVPVPAVSRSGVPGQSKYPFAEMSEGDSFAVPVAVAPDTVTDAAERKRVFDENARTMSNRMTGACRRWREKNPGFVLSVRTMPDESAVRVWRVAKAGEASAPAANPAAPPPVPAKPSKGDKGGK